MHFSDPGKPVFDPKKPWFLFIPFVLMLLLGFTALGIEQTPGSNFTPYSSPNHNVTSTSKNLAEAGSVQGGHQVFLPMTALQNPEKASRFNIPTAFTLTQETAAGSFEALTSPVSATGSSFFTPASVTSPAGPGGQIGTSGPIPALDSFIAQVANGQANLVSGLYAQGVLALQVVQQPPGDSAYISVEEGTTTEFQSASIDGVVGLLAHNFLSGRDFFRLKPAQDMILVFGDSSVQHYRISEIVDFQRLEPDNLRSDFLELNSDVIRTASQVFNRFYRGKPHLTLQTCIEKDGNWSWGVRFIVAEPVAGAGQ